MELKKGQKVYCKNDHIIATVVKDVGPGNHLGMDCFEFHQSKYKDSEEIGNCIVCNAPFASSTYSGFVYFPNVK